MLENLPEWADKLITVSIGAAVMYAAVEFIKKLLINVNKKDERINDIFTAQLQVLMENSTDYKKELTDVKKLILNTTNMSTGDFQTYIATLNRMVYYRMMFEIGDIIDKNHINTNSLELTIRKIKNINDKIFSTSVYDVLSLNFDKVILDSIVEMLKEEQVETQLKLEEIFTEYAAKKDVSQTDDDTELSMNTKKSIKELLSFMLNDLTSRTYSILNKS
jgi:hypothetical protein|nr:MAG TPA: hypothetical protein [Caudoviricetes sp.]